MFMKRTKTEVQCDFQIKIGYELCTDCGTLANPVFGLVTYNGGTLFSDNATYTCDVGYNINGTDMRVCTANGNWSDEAPTCVITGQLTNVVHNSPGINI